MMPIPYAHIDAFTDTVFGGNQAAVMELDAWLPDKVLQAIGEENNFAETAFIVADKSEEADYELRWFTPTSEVILCGHATLASGHYVLEKTGADTVSFRTRRAGGLIVRRDGADYQLALPAGYVAPRDMPELAKAVGVDAPIFDTVKGAEQISIILMEDEAAVRAVTPDMPALKAIDRMAICTAPGKKSDIVSRVFVPAWGVPEDSVTGSAHAALTPFWAERLGKNHFTAHQASQRGGDLICHIDPEDQGDRVWLGGKCVTVVEGRFYLSG